MPSGENCDGIKGNANGNGKEGVEVICVGLMRTGLQSLHRAFKILNYDNVYDQEQISSTFELWSEVIQNRDAEKAFQTMFGNAQVVMGMPTFCFWEDILKLYPNAKVILTVRSEDGWWNSVSKAKIAMDRDVPGAPLRYGTIRRTLEKWLVPSYHKFCEVLRFAWGTTLGATGLQIDALNESTTRKSFRQHNSYVQSVLEGKTVRGGEPQLLVFDVREGWAPLCAFLKKSVPLRTFPKQEDLYDLYYPSGWQRPQWLDRVTGFDELFAPDTEFGTRMRQELLRGLIFALAALTGLVLVVLMAAATLVDLPVTLIVLIYVALVIVGWDAYVVMHTLVLRVPLLMVVPLALQSLLIAAALHACFISYGIFKEKLVTQDQVASDGAGALRQAMSVICSGVAMLVTKRSLRLDAPLLSMSAFAFTNELSTFAGYEMLKYVSFPVQVMAKSVKMLPNMMMGRIVNGTRYSLFQYGQAVAALVCVAIMHFSDEAPEAGPKNATGQPMSENWKLFMGVAMLGVFFAGDSFTSQWQTNLYTRYPELTQLQMMLGGNFLGLVFTSGNLYYNWAKIRQSLDVAMDNPEVLWRIVALGVVSALGQFCIYSAIRILGSLSFTWIMTARQLLSVLISLIFFGHGFSLVKLLCILTVFAIMSWKQLSKIPEKLRRKVSKPQVEDATPSTPFMQSQPKKQQ
eukprot:CAMPEP_0181481932 /NCGR_PEP_ID=MMETSP1110-20121109/44568_1 /TAXON_ID=174948 /ORGANISM="Symbiodinium sp., Strain CCMP421" /LENGTH=685 /DNA_ID=CAMNT_0023607443 /DNA_START=50 /DNA_END=2108 /DNA_ORIENTATION=+